MAKPMNPTPVEYNPPTIAEPQLALLEMLSNACAVSGDEGEVRAIVIEQLTAIFKERSGEYKTDALGNVLATAPGEGPGDRLQVMLAAHMDEIGFMIIQEEEKGIFRFDTVGGIDVRQLPGKPVVVGRDHVPGVIGAKPIHLSKPDELKNTLSIDNLRIDIGLSSLNVKVGDRATFATAFTQIGPSLRGKALDDRLGVATLLELVKYSPENIDLLAAFTVQEEVGLRGAGVAAYTFNPDLAIAIDSTPANDLPNWEDGHSQHTENISYNTRLGAGPAIYIADSSTLSDPRLVRYLAQTAEDHGIPYQFRQPGGGGTDAGAIHKKRAGIPSVSVSIPGRYPHTSASICRLVDWQNTLSLLHAALVYLPDDLLKSER
jgi:tetrahedral aminopeptidase